MTAPANSPTRSPTRSPTYSPTAWKWESSAAGTARQIMVNGQFHNTDTTVRQQYMTVSGFINEA